jgi:hypothetical protein
MVELQEPRLPSVFKNARLVRVGKVSIHSIVDFYKAIGWNGKSDVNTAKVVVNPAFADHLFANCICNGGDPLVWLLNSPNQDSHIPYGVAMLLEGWQE